LDPGWGSGDGEKKGRGKEARRLRSSGPEREMEIGEGGERNY
jgi:hypothetical protein